MTEFPALRPIPAVRFPGDERPTMKATIERATLLKCLSHVQSVVERRNTIPILSNVLIEAASAGPRAQRRKASWRPSPTSRLRRI